MRGVMQLRALNLNSSRENQVRQNPGAGVLPSYAAASELLLVLALM